jgi:hypothetical protein
MESAVLFIFSACLSATMKHSTEHFGEQFLYLPALRLRNSAGQVPKQKRVLRPARLPTFWLKNCSNIND